MREQHLQNAKFARASRKLKKLKPAKKCYSKKRVMPMSQSLHYAYNLISIEFPPM